MTSHPTEPKLPESLEVVAWRKHLSGSEWKVTDYPLLGGEELIRLTDAESALKARDAEIERLRGVVVETRRVLELENSKGAASAIQDTIWRGSAETLFDYLDASLENGGANV